MWTYSDRGFFLFPLQTWTDTLRHREMQQLVDRLRKDVAASKSPLLTAQLEADLESVLEEVDEWPIL